MPAIPSSMISLIEVNLLNEFVKSSTAHFDDSHNWIHAENVYLSTIKIINSLDIDYDEDIITYAAKLHDVCDHKYQNSIPRTELEKFILKNLGSEKTNHVLKIIDNVSFSKEIKGLRETLIEPYNTYLTAISDADRLEAIGKVGIERCETFTKSRNGKIPEDVIIHCHEKLLRLYEDNFIVTKLGREIAKPLHEEIVNYVKNIN
jgi:uncharacterized protein